MGPPPKGASGIRESCQDGPSARTKLVKGELPAERDQGLGTWIRQRTDRPHERPAGAAGFSWVGWTSGATHDTKLTAGERLHQRLERHATSGAGWVSRFVFHAIAVSF